MRIGVVFGLLGIAAGITPALAAEPMTKEEYAAQGTDLSLRLGVGALVQPEYEGSDDYQVAPWPIITLEYLRLPGLGEFGGPSRGFAIGPSFNFVGERDQFDNPLLIGIGTVDAAFEAGVKFAYEVNHWGAYLAVRRGFGGHEGFVGEAMVFGVARPTARWEIRGGPEITFADSEYFDTYFSVNPAQSFLSGLPVYNAGSGFKSVGLAGQATYALTEKVDLHFRAGYTYLLADAGDSPIVSLAGSRDQFTVGAGISYRIDLDLFD